MFSTAKSSLIKSAHIPDITVKCLLPAIEDLLNNSATTEASGHSAAVERDASKSFEIK